jgi:shikimate 5-dehydrogenase
MADLCEGAASRWGVALTGIDYALLKPRLLIVGAGGHGRSVAEAVLSQGVIVNCGAVVDRHAQV